ncbi:MAG TPA: hypothetical protein VK125_08360 [Bacillota bacterium]|nr:hypothetical protein [Bacillota bacterium]
MRQSKYAFPSFWKQKIEENEPFWEGLFENKPITQSSVILNPVIMNPYSDQAENSWIVYPNPQSVIGYLKYLYLPTAFIGLIEEEMDNPYYFVEDLIVLLDELKEENINKMNVISIMERDYIQLDELWDMSESACLEKVVEWTRNFNKTWNWHNVSLNVHLFRSPKEAMNYVIKAYETQELGIEQLENDLGFTVQQLREISSDAIFTNEFMKRKFIDLLDNRLAIHY